MLSRNRSARINIKLVVILVLVVFALGISLVAARQVRRTILSERDLKAGNAAFEKGDWPKASKYLQEYLGRNPDDIEILKKYAKARLAIRPIEGPNIMQTIAAYRRVLQLDPQDEEIYGELAKLYGSIGNFEEVAYIARTRLEHDPKDFQASLWLGEALFRLNKSTEAQEMLVKLTEENKALPKKSKEYVRACGLISSILVSEDTPGAKTKALDWLNKAVRAVDNLPESVEALVTRAQFLRVTADISGLSDEERLARARKDIELADQLGTEDPKIRFLLGTEWMAHGELDRAAAELQVIDNLPQETLEEHFFDINDWKVARFLLASELATRRGAVVEGADLADTVLDDLEERRHRVQVLPVAIPLYVADANVTEARKCLDEYLEALHTQQGAGGSRLRRAYLQAIVAKAEERLYAVIDILRPVAINEASRPELWSLLAETYSRTDQSRRAIGALIKYLRIRPDDSKMTLQLAKEYIKLRDWNRAFETARLAEPRDPTDIVIRLLRIESSIHLATGQPDKVNTTRLASLSAELRELRKDHPERVDIRILQAMIAVYLEQDETAEKELKLAIVECEEPLRAEMQLVRHYYRTKRIKEAISLCQAACKRHSEVAEPWLSQSGLHVAGADYDFALRCLREGLDAVNGHWEKRSVSIRLALLELLYGNRDSGIALLENIVAQDPQEVRARSLLLEIREVQEDPNNAERLVKELKQAEGESGLFWRLHEASLWLSSDDWRSKQHNITDHLQHCIDLDPEWSAPVLLLVKMYNKLEDFKRVEDVCTQALNRNPSATDVADRLVALLEKQGRFSDAEKVIDQIEANPRIISAWNVRMALNAKDFSGAIEELKLRISNDARDVNSRILLARLIYWQDRDPDQAFAYLEEAEAIIPGSMALTAAKVSILKAEGQTDEAQQILDEYVAHHNDDFTAYWMRAVYHAEQGEFEHAEKDYKKLTTFTQQGAAGYERLSNFYASNKKLDDAIITLEEGLNAYPENLGLKRRLMRSLFVRGNSQDRERALEILTALEERLTQDPELMKLRAMQYLREQTPQSLQAAKEKLAKVVQLAPTATDAHLLLIEIAMGEGEYESARDYAIRAIGSNPNVPVLLLARSRAELALDNTQMAVQLTQLALQADPNNMTAMLILAEAYRHSDDMDRSEQWIKRAERLDPNNLVVFEARCLWLGSQRKFVELAEICSTFRSTKEQDLNKVLMVASILSNADSKEFKREAVKGFEYVMTFSPTMLPVKLGLASTLYKVGDVDRAKTLYQKLLEQHPDNIRVLNDLAWILQEHDQNYAEALTLANRGLSLSLNNLYLLDTRGTIFLNMEDRLDDAKKDFEKLVELSPADSPRQARTLLKLGRICAQLNDHDKARQHFEKASEIDQKIEVFTPEERAEITTIIQQSGT